MATDDELPFKVEQWDHDGNRIECVIARAANLIVGRSAYEAVCTPRHGSPSARVSGLSMKRRDGLPRANYVGAGTASCCVRY